MTETIKPNRTLGTSKKTQVSDMFDDISSSYDKVNKFISLGLDRIWKKKLVKIVVDKKAQKILDLATGTADLPLQFAEKGLTDITGLDLSPLMLKEAKKRVASHPKKESIELLQGDSENLPFEDQTFDVVTVSYGIRNYENLEKGLAESYRVLKRKGILVILETSVPHRFPFKQGYALFTKRVMPRVGGVISGDRAAYKYLSESAVNFPCGLRLASIIKGVGFSKVSVQPQSFGAASIYICEK